MQNYTRNVYRCAGCGRKSNDLICTNPTCPENPRQPSAYTYTIYGSTGTLGSEGRDAEHERWTTFQLLGGAWAICADCGAELTGGWHRDENEDCAERIVCAKHVNFRS